MNKLFLSIQILFLLFCSCTLSENERELNPVFTQEPKKILSSSIPVKETFVPVKMAILDDFLVFLNDIGNKQDAFFVYTPEMEFCYSFGSQGQGPQEFISPTPVMNSKNNILSIYDVGSKKVSHYQLTPEKAEYLSDFKLTDDYTPIQEISYVNDSILIYEMINRHGVFLYSYNMQQQKNIDTLVVETDVRKNMGENYNPSLDYYHFSNTGHNFAIAFEFLKEVLTGEVTEEGYFRLTDPTPLIVHKEFESQLSDNKLYYMHSNVTKDFIFAQYYGYIFRNLHPFPINLGKRSFHFLIEVYDWNKNPVISIQPDQELLKICVDEKRKKIYTWNYMKDFEELNVYEISWLDNYK